MRRGKFSSQSPANSSSGTESGQSQVLVLPRLACIELTMFDRLSIILLVGSGACATVAPFTGTAPAAEDAYACAVSVAASRGYAVQAEEEGVFFRAERRIPHGPIHSSERWDVLTVTVAGDHLSVVVDGMEQDVVGTNREREAVQPTSQGRADAEAVLATCGEPER
jgi:hypothetical protein